MLYHTTPRTKGQNTEECNKDSLYPTPPPLFHHLSSHNYGKEAPLNTLVFRSFCSMQSSLQIYTLNCFFKERRGDVTFNMQSYNFISDMADPESIAFLIYGKHFLKKNPQKTRDWNNTSNDMHWYIPKFGFFFSLPKRQKEGNFCTQC